MSLLVEMNEKAMELGIPLSVHIDVTYRCNERCVHCYLDHDDKGEMTTREIKNVLDQLAEAGVRDAGRLRRKPENHDAAQKGLRQNGGYRGPTHTPNPPPRFAGV